MRKKLDPRLRYLLDSLPSPSLRDNFAAAVSKLPNVEILIRCMAETDLQDLKQIGIQIHAVTRGAYTVVAGAVRLHRLPALSALPFVEDVEFPRLCKQI